MNEWITDRRPERDDALDGKVLALYSYPTHNAIEITPWDEVANGVPWTYIQSPKPYPKPKRYTVPWPNNKDMWYVWDRVGETKLIDNIPTREAAERIAAIYEEVMP